MPIHLGKDINGHYYQWGTKTKYYFEPNNEDSQIKAYNRAVKQMKAIYSSGYRGN